MVPVSPDPVEGLIDFARRWDVQVAKVLTTEPNPIPSDLRALSDAVIFHCPECGTENRHLFLRLLQDKRLPCRGCDETENVTAHAPVAEMNRRRSAIIRSQPCKVRADIFDAVSRVGVHGNYLVFDSPLSPPADMWPRILRAEYQSSVGQRLMLGMRTLRDLWAATGLA